MSKLSTYNKDGEEIINDEPMVMPIGFKRPPSIHEFIQRAVRYVDHMRTQEADDQIPHPGDFEMEDPADLGFEDSPYELVTDPDVGEVTRAEKRYLDSQREIFDKGWKGFKPRKKDTKEKGPAADAAAGKEAPKKEPNSTPT